MTNTENDLSRPTVDVDYTVDWITGDAGTTRLFATCLACDTQTATSTNHKHVISDIETHVYAHWTQPETTSTETRESLASLMIRSDLDFWALTIEAREEAEGWYQYTDQDGDTWTTNDPMWTP